MLNRTITFPVPPRRLSKRRRWNAYRPVREQYGGAAYDGLAIVVLALSILYSVAILFDLGAPSLRSFATDLSTPTAVIIDLALLLLALMHFHFVQRPYAVLSGPQIRRSQAMRTQDRLLVSALLSGFFFAWQPLPGLVWAITAPWQVLLMQVGWYFGWLSLLVAAALIEVPSFLRIALRTGVLCCVGFAMRVALAGILCGLLLVEWCAAQMNIGHLLFAGALTTYLCITPFLYRRNVSAASWRPSAMNKGLRLLQE